MKKYLLTVFFALLLLCSCSNTIPPQINITPPPVKPPINWKTVTHEFDKEAPYTTMIDGNYYLLKGKNLYVWEKGSGNYYNNDRDFFLPNCDYSYSIHHNDVYGKLEIIEDEKSETKHIYKIVNLLTKSITKQVEKKYDYYFKKIVPLYQNITETEEGQNNEFYNLLHHVGFAVVMIDEEAGTIEFTTTQTKVFKNSEVNPALMKLGKMKKWKYGQDLSDMSQWGVE